MFRNYFHITFTVERQPHHWDTAGQPIYCQGCTAKQGTKGTESPAGMWNGLDSTSLIITWPGYQCWCQATHTHQKKCLRLWPKEDAWGGTNPQMLGRIFRFEEEWGFAPDLWYSWGTSALQEELFRNYLGKHTCCSDLLRSLHIHVGHFQK